MTKEAIEKLVEMISIKMLPFANGSKLSLTQTFIKKAISILSRTHCIVSKGEVKSAYQGWEQFFGTKKEDEANAARWQLEDIFGSEVDFSELNSYKGKLQ